MVEEVDLRPSSCPSNAVNWASRKNRNEIHHRGQGYVYLRALGIEPPPFYER